MNHVTDAELVNQTRQCGDKDAFGMLLERHHAGALRMARRMIAHEEVARELVQEAMLQAYLSLDALVQPTRFQSWLYGIVINVCRSYLRQRHDDPLSLEALAGGLDATPVLLTSRAPDAQTMAEMRELHELVLAALDTLSPTNRDAVVLFYYEQLSLREISLTLGISMTAVKGRLHKSRRQLASHFTALADRDSWLPQRVSPIPDIAVQKGKVVMIEVEIVDVIILDEEKQGEEKQSEVKQSEVKQGHHVVILLDEAGQRILPIWIGPFEGQNIAMHLLQDNLVPRPLTYDFMASLVKASGATLEEIQISSLHESTYYATAMVRVGDTVHEIDARPSDAMALALRLQSKISVAEDIMARAGREIPDTFKRNLPRKGLEQMAAKLEQTKREHEEMMATFKQRQKQATTSVVDRLFSYVFEE